MNDSKIDELIETALREEQRLPEGLSGRLERRIDTLAAQERAAVKPRASRRRLGWGVGAAAAVGLVAALVFRPEPLPADTYTDPTEAAAAVEQALALLSTRYNEGLDRMARATAQVNEANAMLFRTIQKD